MKRGYLPLLCGDRAFRPPHQGKLDSPFLDGAGSEAGNGEVT